MPLFGSKTDVSISVDRDTLVAGETVRISAGVGELDKKVQGGRFELGYRNTYKEDDTDSDGDRTTRTRTSDVVVATEPIELEHGTMSPGGVEATLTVPSDAPGTAPESIEWFARAVVDRKLARDANAEQPLTVLVPATQLGGWAELEPEVSSSECPMSITASTRVVKPGDTISGTLAITPAESISARAIRVQLRRYRDDPDGNSDVDDSTRVQVCGEVDLTAGPSQAFDFAITVPPDAAPSYDAQYNHQHWFLEGVIDVPRAGDRTVKAEVVVHTA